MFYFQYRMRGMLLYCSVMIPATRQEEVGSGRKIQDSPI